MTVDLSALPDTADTRRIAAKLGFWEACQEKAKELGTPEAQTELKRVGRVLGMVARNKRAERTTDADKPAPTTVATPTPVPTKSADADKPAPTTVATSTPVPAKSAEVKPSAK